MTLSTVVPKLLLSAVAEAVAIANLFPQHLPHNPLLWALVRMLALNFSMFIVYSVFIYPFFVSPLRHLPGPKGGYPLIGHGLSPFKKPPGEDYLKWMKEVPNDGMIAFRGFAYSHSIILTNAKTISEVLVHNPYDFVKPRAVRDALRRVLGDGLVVVEGDAHKFQRKNILPVFGFRHIKELYPMMWKKAVALTQGITVELQEHPDPRLSEMDLAGVVEINHWANKVTMDIIGVAGLGRDFNTLKNSDDVLIKNYEELLNPTTDRVIHFALSNLLPPALVNRLPWKVNELIQRVTSTLHAVCNQLVQEKRELVKIAANEHFDILSVLLKSNNISDQELTDQLLTFLAVGHETTSSAFTWATHLLATHPDVQTRLRTEVRGVLPSDSGSENELTTVLESLPLLNAVCNETLRLYPTVPLTFRNARIDTTIDNVFIPQGTQFILVPWATNRLPQLWGPDADEFVPERWIDKETGKPNNTGGSTSNYDTLTFLHGPRSCIGKDFAKAELRCLIAAFVAAFEMEMADPNYVAIPHGVITTKPMGGMPLKLKVVR